MSPFMAFLRSPDYPYWLIGGTLVFAFVLTMFCYARKYISRTNHFDYQWYELMGGPNWNFSSSWATTLTAVGGLLGTVISTIGNGLAVNKSTTLTIAIQHIALFFFFTIITLLAPLVYSSIGKHVLTKGDDGKLTPEIQGYVIMFFITSVLILWAVCGQLVTVAITLHSLADPGFSNSALTIIFFIALILALVCVVSYAIETIPWTVQDQLNIAAETEERIAEPKNSSPSRKRKKIIRQPITPEQIAELPTSKGNWPLL